MSELLPCPFCGAPAKERVTDIGPGYQTSMVRCTKCNAEVAKCDLDAKLQWNARVQPKASD